MCAERERERGEGDYLVTIGDKMYYYMHNNTSLKKIIKNKYNIYTSCYSHIILHLFFLINIIF